MKKIISFMVIICLCISFIPTISVSAATYTPIATAEYNGHTYQLYEDSMTWEQAKAFCESIDGYLATITSPEEQKFVQNFITKGKKKTYWLGGKKFDTNIHWVTNEKFDYENWGNGEPNGGNTESYLEIVRYGWYSLYLGDWNDTMNLTSGDYSIYHKGILCEIGGAELTNISHSTSAKAPIIKSVNIKKGEKIYNVLNQSVNINKDSNETYSLDLDIDWNGVANHNRQVYISQGLVSQEFSSFYSYNPLLDTFEFVPKKINLVCNKPLYIMAIDKSDIKTKSTTMTTKINIVGLNDDENFQGSTEGIQIGKNISFAIPEDVPIIGGMDLSWGLDYVPITVAYDSDKMSIAVGIKDELEEQKDGSLKFKNLEYKSFKSAIDDYNKGIGDAFKKSNRSLKQLRNDARMSHINTHGLKKTMTMSMWGGKVLKHTGKGDDDIGIDCMGYIEVSRKKNGEFNYDDVHGYINFEISISYTYMGQVFIYVVPCYYEIGGEIGAGLEATVNSIDSKTFAPSYGKLTSDEIEETDEDVKNSEANDPTGIYLKSKVGLKAGAGIGIPKVATFGATGEGSVNFKVGLNEAVEDYVRVFLKAQAGYELTFLGQKLASKDNVLELDPDKAIIYSTFPNDKDKSWIKSKSASLMSVDNLYAEYNANNVYEAESRYYLENSMEWYGDIPPISLFVADYTNKNLTILADSVYPQAQPQIFSVAGKKILVFTADNDTRTANNKQMLVYSVYNDEDGTWSEAVPVADDGTADFYPSVSGEYLVWQNQKSVMGDGLSLAEIGKQGEIVVAKWNGDDFDTPISLTDNDALDTLPKVSVNNNEISIVWLKNSADDILGVDGDTSIVKKVYNGSAWGEEIVLKDNLNSVTDLSVGYCENILNIAYVHDADDDITTIEDREVYLIDSSEKQVTDNEVLDSNAIINNGQLYWYSENNIHFMNLTDGIKSTVFEDARYALADGFTVSENNGNIAILWSGSEDEGSEIKGVLYQEGAWGDVITVSELGAYAKYPTCVLEEDGTILTSFTAEEDGITSLYTLGLFPSYDLAITDIYYTESTLALNSENEFEVMVTNNGELPVEGYTINVYNEDESLNNSILFEDTIKAGESKTVVGKFITGDTISYETLKIEIVLNADEEYVYDNNSVTLSIGNGDISIENVAVYEMLPTSCAIVNVANIGYSDIDNVTVNLRADSEDGDVIFTKNIGVLESEQSIDVRFEYNPQDYENVKWYVTVETEADEVSVGNNYDYFINECAVGLEDYEISILNYSYADKHLTVNAFAKNNTDDSLTADAVFAVYSKDGRLKGITNQPLSIGDYSDTGIDVWFENYTYVSGDNVKMFMWDSTDNLRPLVNSARVEFTNLDYEISILNYSYTDKQLIVNGYAKNNTSDVLSADAIFAVYSNDGRMKGIATQPLSVDGYSDTGIDVWFENYNYANGDFVKMFVWRRLNNIKPMVEAKQVTLIIN